MSRAQKATRRGKQSTKSAQAQPAKLGDGKGRGLTKRTGLERPDAWADAPKSVATKSSIVKTNS